MLHDAITTTTTTTVAETALTTTAAETAPTTTVPVTAMTTTFAAVLDESGSQMQRRRVLFAILCSSIVCSSPERSRGQRN